MPSVVASSSSPHASKVSPSKQTKSMLVTLRLSPSVLKKFPHEKSEESVSSPASSALDSTPNAAASTPNSSLLVPPANPTKRKGIPGPKPGMKRTASQLAADAIPKPRGKPGPKKKMKIDGVNGTSIPISAPKLNPKANQGAINANLRALDRSGKPCRRWSMEPFRVKSFTGIAWAAPSWGAFKRSGESLSIDGKSVDSSQASEIAKAHLDSSAVPSDKSNSGEGDTPLPAILEPGASPAMAVA